MQDPRKELFVVDGAVYASPLPYILWIESEVLIKGQAARHPGADQRRGLGVGGRRKVRDLRGGQYPLCLYAAWGMRRLSGQGISYARPGSQSINVYSSPSIIERRPPSVPYTRPHA